MHFKKRTLFIVCFWALLLCFAQVAGAQEPTRGALDAKAKRMLESLLVEGQKFFIIDDYAKALQQFQRAAEVAPQNATVQYKMAQVLIKSKRLDDALAPAKRAVQLDPSNPYYRLQLAQVHEQQGNYALTVKTYEDLINALPGQEQYLYQLGALHYFEGKYDKALEAYNRAQAFYGINKEVTLQKQNIYKKLKQYDKAFAIGNALVEAYPNEPGYLVMQLRLAEEIGQPAQAKGYLQKLMAVDPDNPEYQLKYVQLALLDNPQQALYPNLKAVFQNQRVAIKDKAAILQGLSSAQSTFLTEAQFGELNTLLEEQAGNQPDYWLFAGQSYRQQNQLGLAVQAFGRAAEGGNTDLEVLRWLVSTELSMGLFNKAYEHANTSIEVYPNEPLFFVYAAMAATYQQKLNRAQQQLSTARLMVRNNPEQQAQWQVAQAVLYRAQQNSAQATQAFEKAFELAPGNALVRCHYALFIAPQNPKKALQLTTQLVAQNTQQPNQLHAHAWSLYHNQQYNQALDFIIKATKHSQNGMHFEHYGDILFQLGQVDEAVTQWQKAAALPLASGKINQKIASRSL